MDPGTLAAYREGLLSRRRAARVAAHLSGCPQCAETDAQLAGVTTILASSPAPPMPAGLADRIGAALAAEAASRAAGQARPAAGAAGSGVTAGATGDLPPARPPREHPHRPPRRSWLTPRIAAVTAAVVVVLGGGYGVVQLLSQSTGTTNTSSGASSAGHSAARSGAAAGSANRMEPSSGLANNLTLVSSGTDYQRQRLASQAKTVLVRHALPRSRPAGTGQGKLPSSFGSTFAHLPACVQRVSGGHTPKLVDLASYQGQRAAVIMLPAARHQVRVVVVGPECSGTASDVLAQALVPAAG
jgi:putative zinc finger protein